MRIGRRLEIRGLATLEAALIMPFLLMVTFAVLEYSWMFIRIQQINNAARAGVRVAVLPDSVNADVDAVVGTLMNAANINDGQFQTIVSAADITALAPGDIVTVTVSAAYEDVGLIGMAWHPLPANLQASVSMTKEGP